MLTELIFFGLSLALGVLSGLLHLLFSFVFKKLRNRAAAVTVQFLLASAAICAFTLIAFFVNDGKFTLYSALSLAIGFFAPAAFVSPKKQ